MAGLGLMNRRRAIASFPTASSLERYQSLVGNADDYVSLPIAYRVGYSYKYSLTYISSLANSNTTGWFAAGGINIYHSTYRDLRISGLWTAIWSQFAGLETLEFTPMGIIRNGKLIASNVITSDQTMNIFIFGSPNHTPCIGNYVHLHSLEVWDSDGVMVHKYIPCKFDDVVGLYDEVEGIVAYSKKNTLTVQ